MTKPSRADSRQRRRQRRAQGLRPIEIWVPDIHSASLPAEAHRQSLAVAASAYAAEDQAFIDATSNWPESIESK